MTERLLAGFLITLTIGAPVFGAESTKLVHITNTQQVAFQSGGTVRVNHSFGELWIEGWDQPDVEITVTKSPDELYSEKEQAKAARLADNVKVTTDRPSTGELVISMALASRKWVIPSGLTGDIMLQCRIRVPRDAKLIVHHKDGEVLVSNMMGDIEATGRGGDLVVLLPQTGKYAIDAASHVGTLSSDFEGNFHHGIWSSGFKRTDSAPTHRVYLREGIGGIEIKASPPEAIPPSGAAND